MARNSEILTELRGVATSLEVSGLYCLDLADLCYSCANSENTLHPVSFTEASLKLIKSVQRTLNAFDKHDRPITEFKFGKCFVSGKTRTKLKANDTSSWNIEKGIVADWNKLEPQFSAVAILGCVNKDVIPMDVLNKIRFRSSDNSKRKVDNVDHKLYSQGLLNALIQHFLFVDPDHRMRNASFESQYGEKDNSIADAIYMAFNVDKPPPPPPKETQPQKEIEKSVTHPSNSGDSEEEFMYRVIYPEHGSRKLVKIKKSEIGSIKRKLHTAFDCAGSVTLDYSLYMSEDDEWYECEADDLPPRGKLKVTARKKGLVEDRASTPPSPPSPLNVSRVSPNWKSETSRKVQNVRPLVQQKSQAILKKAKKLAPQKRSAPESSSESAQKARKLDEEIVSSSRKSTDRSASRRSVASSKTIDETKESSKSPESGRKICVKDLEPGQHEEKMVVTVSTMTDEMISQFKKLDCVFNMHFEDDTGDIFGYVQPPVLFRSLVSGKVYEIENFEVWKSPENVYGVSLDDRTVINMVKDRGEPKKTPSTSSGSTSKVKALSDSHQKKKAPVIPPLWTEKIEERLLQIFEKMKKKFDRYNWKYVSEKLGTGHTNEHCRIKVRSLLHEIEKEAERKKNQDTDHKKKGDKDSVAKKTQAVKSPSVKPAQRETKNKETNSSPEKNNDESESSKRKSISGKNSEKELSGVQSPNKEVPMYKGMDGVIHKLINIPKSDVKCQRKKCMFCLIKRQKTAGGCPIETKFKCNVCKVPLCSNSMRNCFELYHKQVVLAKDTLSVPEDEDVKGKKTDVEDEENDEGIAVSSKNKQDALIEIDIDGDNPIVSTLQSIEVKKEVKEEQQTGFETGVNDATGNQPEMQVQFQDLKEISEEDTDLKSEEEKICEDENTSSSEVINIYSKATENQDSDNVMNENGQISESPSSSMSVEEEN